MEANAALRAEGSLCMTCAVRRPCMGSVAAEGGTRELQAVLTGRLRLRRAEVLAARPDGSRPCVHVVRVGSLKTLAGRGAQTQLRALHFPGELVDADATWITCRTRTLVALEDTELCVLRCPDEAAAAGSFQGRLWDMRSRALLREHAQASVLGGLAPESRVIAALADAAVRMRAHGTPAGELDLHVDAADLGSYLGLPTAQLAAALAGLAERGLVALAPARVRILQPESLQQQALRRGPELVPVPA